MTKTNKLIELNVVRCATQIFHFIRSELINMLYFNKTAADIWCRSNLDVLADKDDR